MRGTSGPEFDSHSRLLWFLLGSGGVNDVPG